jgi:hypothetical protein
MMNPRDYDPPQIWGERLQNVHRTPLRGRKSSADWLFGTVATDIAHRIRRKTRHFQCIVSICS